ncbi:MAG TPA: hypothetical protein VLT79_00085 [Gemmatimonadales bacterium]|nr:hypothetical protein [Gemmatimonadales bacterium]
MRASSTLALLLTCLFAPVSLRSQTIQGPPPVEPAHSAHHWTTTNVVLAGAYAASVWIDLAQTRYFLKDPKWEESNPILGRHPSPTKVDLLGLAGVGAMMGVAHVVGNPWRNMLLALGVVVEARVIAWNSTGGVGIRLY